MDDLRAVSGSRIHLAEALDRFGHHACFFLQFAYRALLRIFVLLEFTRRQLKQYFFIGRTELPHHEDILIFIQRDDRGASVMEHDLAIADRAVIKFDLLHLNREDLSFKDHFTSDSLLDKLFVSCFDIPLRFHLLHIPVFS